MLSPHNESFLVARIGGGRRLLELSRVREIVPAMALSRPDGLAGGCRGVANVRGDALPIFDMEHREGALDPSQLIVVAATEGGNFIGIVVDDIAEVLELPRERVAPHPAGLGRHARSVQWGGAILSVLTPREVIDAA